MGVTFKQDKAAGTSNASSKGRGLPGPVKNFIVLLNACGYLPSEVAREVGAKYGLTITRQLVEKYNPAKAGGQRLSKDLRVLFERLQKRYRQELDRSAGAHARVRIDRLDRWIDEAVSKGDLKTAVAATQAQRREMLQEVYVDEDEDQDLTDQQWLKGAGE